MGPPVCDYEGSHYRTEFWEDQDRAFEDAADRAALRRLLPAAPGRLVDVGAGYGRLVDLYSAADHVYLVDYARSMLEDAAGNWPSDRVTLVCADLYHLPFATGAMDTVVQVRVLHHVEDTTGALLEVARVLGTGGSYVLEYANKRHAKALMRYAFGAQDEDPFDPRPQEFVKLNWDLHPAHVEAALSAVGLHVRERRGASHFRFGPLKRAIPAGVLARIDSAVGRALGPVALGPSQYLRAARLVGPPAGPGLWRCPHCGHEPLAEAEGAVPCPRCRRTWPIEKGIYIFRDDMVAA